MRFRMSPLVIVSIVCALQQSSGQEPAAVGSKAPGFTLHDQRDQPVSLDELRKDRHVALVFHRSADW